MATIELPESLLEKIKDGIQKTRDLDVFLNRVQLTGRDITVQRTENEKNRNQLLKDKQGFFPNSN